MVPGRPRPTLFPYTTLFRSTGGLRRCSPEIRPAPRAAASRAGAGRGRKLHQLVADRQPGPPRGTPPRPERSEEHTSELQSHVNLVCRLLLEKKKIVILIERG